MPNISANHKQQCTRRSIRLQMSTIDRMVKRYLAEVRDWGLRSAVRVKWVLVYSFRILISDLPLSGCGSLVWDDILLN